MNYLADNFLTKNTLTELKSSAFLNERFLNGNQKVNFDFKMCKTLNKPFTFFLDSSVSALNGSKLGLISANQITKRKIKIKQSKIKHKNIKKNYRSNNDMFK